MIRNGSSHKPGLREAHRLGRLPIEDLIDDLNFQEMISRSEAAALVPSA